MSVNIENRYGYLRTFLVGCLPYDDDDTVLNILLMQLIVWFISNQFMYEEFSSPTPAAIVTSDRETANSHFVPYPSKI